MRPITRPYFFLFFLGRLFLPAFHHLFGSRFFSLWSRPFPVHVPSLTFLSRQDAALALLNSLPLYDLVLWTNGSVSSHFVKGGSGALANCSLSLSVALMLLSSFRQAQYVQIFPLKPVPFCKLFAGLGSTNKSATSLFLLSGSCSVLTTLCSPLFFLLSLSL